MRAAAAVGGSMVQVFAAQVKSQVNNMIIHPLYNLLHLCTPPLCVGLTVLHCVMFSSYLSLSDVG